MTGQRDRAIVCSSDGSPSFATSPLHPIMSPGTLVSPLLKSRLIATVSRPVGKIRCKCLESGYMITASFKIEDYNLVPRVSLPLFSPPVQGVGKNRDPGNEAVKTFEIVLNKKK